MREGETQRDGATRATIRFTNGDVAIVKGDTDGWLVTYTSSDGTVAERHYGSNFDIEEVVERESEGIDVASVEYEARRIPAAINTAQYDPAAYANLHDYFVVKDVATRLEIPLQQLGKLIQGHGLSDVIGISLLHKHFPLYSDEILCRKFENNSFSIEPMLSGSASVTPFVWGYVKVRRDEPYRLRPLEFIQNDNDSKVYLEPAFLIEASSDFHAEFFAELSRLGLANVLGLGLIPSRLIRCAKGQHLMENDVPSMRRLILAPEELAANAPTATQTLWTFEADGRTRGRGWCVIHCGFHPPPVCQVHCGIHVPACQVHCGIHPPPVQDLECIPCKTSPTWPLAVAALQRAKSAGLVTADTWQSLLTLSVYTIEDINALAGLIAATCGDCLTKEVFG